MSSCLSRKSTPMVASARLGNSPAHSRCVRQVFPTAESPITSTLKVRQRLIREDTLPTELENSRDDSIVGPRRARRVHEETKAQRKRVQGDLQERETASNKDAGLSPQKTGLFVCVCNTHTSSWRTPHSADPRRRRGRPWRGFWQHGDDWCLRAGSWSNDELQLFGNVLPFNL